jgi:hypothetical protein
MWLTEFMHLKKPKQVELLYKEAVYIAKRKEGNLVSVLYQLDGFYVEVLYLKYRWQIGCINAFESVDLLDPYLEFMDVEELIND